MDQRVDNERRLETAPGREAKPAVGQARPDGPWLERLRARRRMVLILTALVIVAVAATVFWWVNSVAYESTDDAFIDARTVPVSAQISAAIVDVPVTDNQLVEAGAVLLRLDDRDYPGSGRSGQGADEPGAGEHRQCRSAGRGAAGAHRAGRETDRAVAGGAHFRKQEDDRTARWSKPARSPSSRRSNTPRISCRRRPISPPPSATKVATRKAASGTPGAARRRPRRKWNRRAPRWSRPRPICRARLITAPVAGRVDAADRGQRRLRGGRPGADDVRAARGLGHRQFQGDAAALVRPGDPVDIKIDAYPHRKFKGHVDSIQAGSGTAFSLLPAENATGNYVKIVQRVPVKIVFDEPPDVLLGPGMSVVPTVKVR